MSLSMSKYYAQLISSNRQRQQSITFDLANQQCWKLARPMRCCYPMAPIFIHNKHLITQRLVHFWPTQTKIDNCSLCARCSASLSFSLHSFDSLPCEWESMRHICASQISNNRLIRIELIRTANVSICHTGNWNKSTVDVG